MANPLVTVVCLCYNHEHFVKEALESIFSQNYSSLQVIVVDDASTDNSVEEIMKLNSVFDFTFIPHTKNLGNCASFNEALALAKGKYIIDFATDDVLGEEQISKQVTAFEAANERVGVIFSNAVLLDEKGGFLNYHYPIDANSKSVSPIPSGDIYKELVKRYFVCPPSMMVRKTVLDELNGYDETLSYEDFDFWIRSSRNWEYHYIDAPLVKKRISNDSLSTRFQNKKWSKEMHSSTLQVCKKIYALNHTKEEYKALLFRIGYEGKQAFKQCHFLLFVQFGVLWVRSFWKSL